MASNSIGKFSVLNHLGTGAHSSILHIRRADDAKHYALKVVPIDGKKDVKFLKQAEHEYRMSQMLAHPNLLKVIALDVEKDWLFQPRKVFLLLEFVDGKTLDNIPKLNLAHLVQVFVKVADGLVHMHKRGVYHADLKPGNIMLSRKGEVKIIDFGLAWVKGEPKDRVQGTPEYIAPETATQKIVNERSDIYNFGATMYRMFTGQLAPATMNSAGPVPLNPGLWSRLLKPAKALNPRLPPSLTDLIDRCMAFDPDRRPERISAAQGILDHLADELVRTDADRLEGVQW